MAQIPHVQPGEVIRSSFINGLIDQVNALATGGPGPGVTVPDVFGLQLSQARSMITQPSVNLTLGTTLDSLGTLIDPNTVTSGSRVVIGQAPPALTRVPVGAAVNLTVAGPTSETPVGGQVDVTFDSVTPATVVAGSPVTFRYEVSSRASQTAHFVITPTVSVASNQTQWQNALEVRDDNDQPLPQGRISLNPNQTRFVRIHIASVPTAPANATFTLTVGAIASGVTSHPDSRTFTVGQSNPSEDTSIKLETINSVPLSALVGSTVRLSAGGVARINCRATFTVVGVYDVSAVIASGTNWTAERNTGSTPATYEIQTGDLTSGSAVRNPEFLIRAQPGASVAGSVDLRLQRQGQSTMRTRRLSLERV